MDNSIQQIINTLSNEIIQLKYKNETNVTMRIDTIIEFLEQLKTDIIGEQQDQKFDLHRTATNCTITILDENDDPITDGSNKLSYGDIITISATADAGYENPTLSVNGLPFTSGDTLVVKADLNIVGTATAVAPSMVAFAVGQVFNGFDFGNVNNGDTSAELDNFLLTNIQQGGSESSTSYFVIGDGEHNLVGLNASFMQEGLGIIYADYEGMTIVYATQDFDIQGVSGSKGFQNLTNGKYIFENYDIVDQVSVNIADTSWNGTLIGAVEAEPTVVLTPFVEGDNPTTFNIGDKIGFDTSKVSEFTQLLETNDYQSQPMWALFTLTNSDATYGEMFFMADLSALGNGGTGYLLYKYIPSTNTSIPIFATTNGEIDAGTGSISFTQGFQSSISGGVLNIDRELQIGSLNTETTSVSWNGVLIGKLVEN